MRSGWREQAGSDQEERALVRRLLAGDQGAFEVFSESYIPAVYRFAHRILSGQGDSDLTREIVQTTMCKAIASLRTFRGESGLMTWLCACCRNEIAAHFRRQGRAVREVALDGHEIATGAPGPEQALLHKEKAERVHAALDALPPHYGQALEWKYLDKLPVDEIAARLNVRPKAAESLLTRARQAFRDAFGRSAAGMGTIRKGPWAKTHPIRD